MADNYKALSENVDKEAISKILTRVDNNSLNVDELVNGVVAKFCKPLDDLMNKIKTIVEDDRNPPTDAELDQMTLKLPACLYFVGEAQEALGIREDVAKAIKMDVYNKVRDKVGGTVADKDTKAELASQQEYIVYCVYSRAYKKVKNRMEAGYEMLNSVKKVINRRMSEAQLAGVSSGRLNPRATMED